MTEERYKEICWETHRRLNLWLDNSTFEEMTAQYSRVRFHMAIGLGGYPFIPEPWMSENEYKPFVTDKEFDSHACDQIVDCFFDDLMGDAEPFCDKCQDTHQIDVDGGIIQCDDCR